MTKKILIADDEVDILETLEKRLRSSGYDVIQAVGGKEAFQKAKREKPDLIILDILMPGVDGVQAEQAIKSDPSTKHIPVIFLTSLRKKEEEKEDGSEIEGKVVLAKQFEIQELLIQVRELIG